MASEGLQLCEKLTACGEQLILMLDLAQGGGSDKHVVMAELTRQAFVVIMHKIPNRANVISHLIRE
ncbi:MAG: hypothetical protein GDA56_19300 [Hormoscilla sp. GM7CHS1pb]|nr:hypothetical protein [Hormoscilla sp. GM7CHS1pb]